MHSSVNDLSGKKFGKLKVIKFVYSKKLYDKGSQKRAFFLCKCDCGGNKIVPGILLHNKNTQSCGCIVPPKYSIDEKYFEKINREDKAYFLGLLITDGTVSAKNAKAGKRIVLDLDKKDKHILDAFRKYLKTKKPLGHSKRKGRHYEKYSRAASESYILSIINIKMWKDIIKLGITPRKTKTIGMPKIGVISHKLMRHFIRGVFDGDGTASRSGRHRHVNITSGSLKFLKQLKKYLKKYKIFNTSISIKFMKNLKTENPNKIFVLRFNSALKKDQFKKNKTTAENLKLFFNILYKKASKDLYFKRKKLAFMNVIK